MFLWSAFKVQLSSSTNVTIHCHIAATVEPRTIFDKLDFTWISQFFEQLMARVDELRDQYEIDLEQIGEAWLRMQKQAGAWFDEMKNKLTWKCVIHTI